MFTAVEPYLFKYFLLSIPTLSMLCIPIYDKIGPNPVRLQDLNQNHISNHSHTWMYDSSTQKSFLFVRRTNFI